MKELSNSFISNLHWLLLLYGLYGGWTFYDEHVIQMEEITNRGAGLDQEIVNAQKKVREIQEFVKKTEEYKVRVEEVAKNIESVQKQLPAETNDSQILSFFQQEINSLNLKDASLSPGSEESSVYFIGKDYTLKAKGTFLQFLIFFERIGSADRIYNIKSLKLSSSNDIQKGRFQVIDGEAIVQAYRFNPEFRVDRGFEK